MSVVQLGKGVLGLLDALALISLYSTTEVRSEAGLMVLTIFLIRVLGVRLRSLGVLVTLVSAVIVVGVLVTVKFHVYPIVVAAHVGVVVHALLWLGKDEVRDRVLRLSMGFVNLSLASALTTELYLFGSIFVFAILGSLYVSLGFLEAMFKLRLPDQLERSLPRGYLRHMFSVSMAVFVLSVLLFPIIPRTSWKRDDGGGSYFSVGYSDTVDLLTSAQADLRQSSRVAFRVFSQTPEIVDDPHVALPLGMFRGQALDIFDGVRWLQRVNRNHKQTKRISRSLPFEKARFEVIREPHIRNLVFKPYGTHVIDESRDVGRSRYVYIVEPNERVDVPDDLDLSVPLSVRSPRLEALAKKLMGDEDGALKKALLLTKFYQLGFSGSLVSKQHETSARAALETFLFSSKSGNCELFAGSAAILLRLAKVPARLVAGYRVGRSSSSGLLTVLDNDAHAWVEYWSDTLGWQPLDPTPKYALSSSWMDSMQQLYWVAEGFWFRWLVNFNQNAEEHVDSPQVGSTSSDVNGWNPKWLSWSNASKDPVLYAIAALLLLVLVSRLALGLLSLGEVRKLFGVGLSWNRRVLYLEYLRFQRMRRKVLRLSSEATELSRTWDDLYASLRFGPPRPDVFRQAMRDLARVRAEFKHKSM